MQTRGLQGQFPTEPPTEVVLSSSDHFRGCHLRLPRPIIVKTKPHAMRQAKPPPLGRDSRQRYEQRKLRWLRAARLFLSRRRRGARISLLFLTGWHFVELLRPQLVPSALASFVPVPPPSSSLSIATTVYVGLLQSFFVQRQTSAAALFLPAFRRCSARLFALPTSHAGPLRSSVAQRLTSCAAVVPFGPCVARVQASLHYYDQPIPAKLKLLHPTVSLRVLRDFVPAAILATPART